MKRKFLGLRLIAFLSGVHMPSRTLVGVRRPFAVWHGVVAPWRGLVAISLFCFALLGCGVLGGKSGGGGKNLTNPVAGLTATGGNAQIVLNWSPYPGSQGYEVKRSTTPGGPYNYINFNLGSPITTTTYTDACLTNSTTYYYVVAADGSWGVSNPSNEASATPSGPSKSVAVTIGVLSSPHVISRLIYGGAFPAKLATPVNAQSTAPNIDVTSARWGGNGSSTYNWETGNCGTWA